jgi:hypothetical protein
MNAPAVDSSSKASSAGRAHPHHALECQSEHLFGWTAEVIGKWAHTLIPERNRARHDRTVEASPRRAAD